MTEDDRADLDALLAAALRIAQQEIEQVAAFVETEPPSVLVHVTVPPAFCSCIVSVPLAAVLLLLVMLAANPERVPVSERESSTAAKMHARSATGANRTRFSAGVRSLSDTGTSSEW